MIQQLPEALWGDGTPADVFKTGSSEETAHNTTSEWTSSYGKIVNMASIAARKGRPLATAYSASKSSVVSITQSVALTLAPYRINVTPSVLSWSLSLCGKKSIETAPTSLEQNRVKPCAVLSTLCRSSMPPHPMTLRKPLLFCVHLTRTISPGRRSTWMVAMRWIEKSVNSNQ